VKLLFFDDFKLGALAGNTVVDVSNVVRGVPHGSAQELICGVIERFTEFKPQLEAAVRQRKGVPLAQVRLRPPLPRPTNIICMAANYLEYGTWTDPYPIDAFQKSGLTVIGDRDTMVLPDEPASIFEGEAELAVVVGRPCSHVSEADAMSYVFGYTNFIDGSARGLPYASNFYYQQKSRETFSMAGPYLVTADEIEDPMNLQVRQWNNGVLMQDYNTSDTRYSIAKCIEWIAAVHPLEAGDLVAMGTNHRGLHAFQDGDRIEQEIDGLGCLHISVRDDLKRRWPRETRGQRLARGHGKWIGEPTPQESGKYAPQTTTLA
jgi:2-keto-4-pentenoate hydratase/2-oxohepta-3-ene-1,7-dioic acid hydratase in catechol pathway